MGQFDNIIDDAVNSKTILENMIKSATELYNSAYWTTTSLTVDEQVALWENFRKAFNLPLNTPNDHSNKG